MKITRTAMQLLAHPVPSFLREDPSTTVNFKIENQEIIAYQPPRKKPTLFIVHNTLSSLGRSGKVKKISLLGQKGFFALKISKDIREFREEVHLEVQVLKELHETAKRAGRPKDLPLQAKPLSHGFFNFIKLPHSAERLHPRAFSVNILYDGDCYQKNFTNENELINRFLSVCKQVQWLHDQGIFHGDLKLDNLFYLGKQTFVCDNTFMTDTNKTEWWGKEECFSTKYMNDSDYAKEKITLNSIKRNQLHEKSELLLKLKVLKQTRDIFALGKSMQFKIAEMEKQRILISAEIEALSNRMIADAMTNRPPLSEVINLLEKLSNKN